MTSGFDNILLGIGLLGLVCGGCGGTDYEELSRRQCEQRQECGTATVSVEQCAEDLEEEIECANESLSEQCIEADDERLACINGLSCEQLSADPYEPSHPCNSAYLKADEACVGVDFVALMQRCAAGK